MLSKVERESALLRQRKRYCTTANITSAIQPKPWVGWNALDSSTDQAWQILAANAVNGSNQKPVWVNDCHCARRLIAKVARVDSAKNKTLAAIRCWLSICAVMSLRPATNHQPQPITMAMSSRYRSSFSSTCLWRYSSQAITSADAARTNRFTKSPLKSGTAPVVSSPRISSARAARICKR